MDQNTLIIVGIAIFVALSVGGVAFLFLENYGKNDNRIASVASRSGGRSGKKNEKGDESGNQSRRKRMQASLKNSEENEKKKNQKISLRLQLEQAGLTTSVKAFYIFSLIVGLAMTFFMLVSNVGVLPAFMSGFVTAFGVPRWALGFMIKRRRKTFGEEFANAVDVIVRGVKAGLPVNDCLRIISEESAEPVRSEFFEVVEGQKIGVSLEEGLSRVYARIPLPEVNFFMITLVIQQKSGGNLAEALANLSRVLRDRKKMQGKIQAMSQEAKSSAAIIGALPPGVMSIMYIMSPEYIELLFTTKAGNAIIVGSLLWMGLGILVMRKLINFKF